MTRRFTTIAAAALAATAVAPATSHALTVGISDQNATTFSDAQFSGLKFKAARYIAPYDVVSDPQQKMKWEAWLAGARGKGQKVLISFEHSRKSRTAAAKVPSKAEFTKAVTSFKKLYGKQVNEVSPWNEVNRKFDKGRGEGQPIWNKPAKAAEYYGVALKVFKGKKVVALDVLDENNVKPSVRYITNFLKAVKKQKLPTPKIWGLHPYSDTNRFSTKRTKAMIKATKSGEIWLTEASGLVAFGGAFPYDEQRAAKANKCMFTIAKLSRVKRLYYFGYFPGSFDAGLIGYNGQPRPGYTVVAKRQSGPCNG